MTRDPNCVFCKIISADLPAQVIFDNESFLVFLDIGPLAEGHLLAVVRDHYANLTDLPADACARLAGMLPLLGRAVLEVTGAEGFNVLVNQGAAAGQSVPHLHVHLIPRRSGDGLGYRWNAGSYPEGRAAQLASAYQKVLSRMSTG